MLFDLAGGLRYHGMAPMVSHALKLGLKPGPRVGALIEAVEQWWIAGDFTADRAACLAELERLVRVSP